jgi:hypothetical protein
MLILFRINCAFSPDFALSRTPLSEFQQPVKAISLSVRVQGKYPVPSEWDAAYFNRKP